ncbi:hypothetical protein HN011_000126 [Eciton burchellii]|nr:hypothetical protein HN011_000126 [Eciton burchellii]
MDKNMANQNRIDTFLARNAVLEEHKILLESIEYMLQLPLPGIRIDFIHAFNYWLKISDDNIRMIADITHAIYVAGLMIDDVQDNSLKRGGMLTAHNIYGIGRILTAGNYAFTIAMEKIVRLKNPKVTKIISEHLLELVRGQGIDIIWRDEFDCPSEEDYKHMILQKTGSVFSLSASLMKLFSSFNEDLSLIVTLLGLYIQIRDDYCNLYSSNEFTEYKGFCEDLTEGKFSFVIIHALRTRPEDKELSDILKQRTNDVKLKRRCIQLLEEYGSFKYTRKVLDNLEAKTRSEIDRLGGNPILINILNNIKSLDKAF